ncbi:MAG: hypothetical protein E7322_08320 [Clostridiales bacterium]|nr:hypothetical protein [Clostridiales bacterium]
MNQMRSAIRLVSILLVVAILAVSVSYMFIIKANRAKWINLANNTRVQDAKKITVQGKVLDSAGVVLSESSAPGERHYISDDNLRRALSHTIGDQKNMSFTGVENLHATKLLDMSETKTGYMIQKLTGQSPIGNDLYLTISSELTEYILSVFPAWKSGAVCVINYETGAILAMLSLPNYDPADMSLAVQDTAYYNRVLQKRYAPGSTFKIITLVSALENLGDVQKEEFTCNGIWNYSDFALRCASGAVHGDMSLTQAFADSCNVTFGSLAHRLGSARLKTTAENFGFNFEFNFEDIRMNASNILKNRMNAEDAIQAGIGQGTTEVTPLHMAMISGAIANKGVMMEPKLIKEMKNAQGVTVSTMTSEVFKIATTPEIAEEVARCMYETVRGGTGTRAAISGYTGGYVCGKTGSAEWTNDKTRETNAWYTGFLYGDKAHPYAIAIVVEEGGYGGTAAAPMAAKILKKAMDLNLY